jgi:hypothetical protein
MKKNILMLFFLLCGNIFSSRSQSFTIIGNKTFGGNNHEWRGNILYIGNGQFIIGGESETDINGDKSVPLCSPVFNVPQDLWILKIDTAFNIHWQRNIGGNYFDRNPVFKQTNNLERFTCSTWSGSDSSCDKSEDGFNDYWVILMDTLGNLLMNETFTGNSSEQYPEAVQLSTGEFVISGQSISTIGGDKTVNNYGYRDFWTIKFDSTGSKIWDNVYGGSDNDMSHMNHFEVLACDNGSFLIAGKTESPISGNISEPPRGANDVWIIKVDSSGNKIWDKRFGGSWHEVLTHITPTNDNGFILCAETSSPMDGDISYPPLGTTDFWVVKMDSVGNKQWDKRYGGSSFNGPVWIEQDLEGGYIVAGTVNGDSSLDISEPAYGVWDYWVIKIDSIGTKIWDKRFGGPGDNYLTSFVILPDTSIMLFGYADTGISAVKTDFGKGNTDFWLVHLKYGSSSTGIDELQETIVSIYPNPTNGTINIPEKLVGSTMSINDATGRLLYLHNYIESATINIDFLSLGYYIFSFKKDDILYRGKVIKN